MIGNLALLSERHDAGSTAVGLIWTDYVALRSCNSYTGGVKRKIKIEEC